MSLLKEIQEALLQGHDLGPILLKVRFLASRLGNTSLEAWVKYEAEGYPDSVELPDYRRIPIVYRATFSGPFGAGVRNAPVPPFLIHKHAGERWNTKAVAESVSAIDALIAAGKNGTLHVSASDLILVLQGHMYESYACNEVTGSISTASLVSIENVVRAKVLELTIELEKAVPGILEVGVDQKPELAKTKDDDAVTHIVQNIVSGNLTNISNSGAGAQFNLNISQRNEGDFAEALICAGLPKGDARELAKIVAAEEPESKAEPFGPKAQTWVAKNIGKAIDGTWKVGIAVATKVLSEAAVKYYGL